MTAGTAPPGGPTVVIAGATGFVGWALCRSLGRHYRVVGLSRVPPASSGRPVEWRPCDLFSLLQCEEGLSGADYAVYLVHSMSPSARLTQGSFEDMDLICADNFARAAAKAGVRRILYLGGLTPADRVLSPHLKSRLEVEETLGSRGVPVTALRAGIVIGPHGSSFSIFKRLVERVPLIPCPVWTRSRTQPVALEDVLALLRWCLENPDSGNRAYDIGSPDVMTYRELLERTAAILGLRRTFVDAPFSGTMWCRRGLRWATGASDDILAPLLESVQHDMVARDRGLQERAGIPGIPFEAAVSDAVAREKSEGGSGRPPAAARAAARRTGAETPGHNDVRSVQRMPLPPGMTARMAAVQYGAWLPRRFGTILRAEMDGEINVRLYLAFPRIVLLEHEFARERSGRTDRQVFIVRGGALAGKTAARRSGRPRLEFREALGGTVLLVAIHDYTPSLPWFLYKWTQALLHLWVVRGFAEYLREAARREIRR